MNKTLLKKYASLEVKKRKIEEEQAEIKEQILTEFRKANIEKAETPYGKFTIIKRSVWIFSPKVKELEGKINDLKQQEQIKGIAKQDFKESMAFYPAVEPSKKQLAAKENLLDHI